MKRNSIHIRIPKPCTVGWENMDATQRGAFCHSCQTEVLDFSAMTDREVIEYLSGHKVGCGRFSKDQLDRKLILSKLENGALRWRALFLSFISLLSFRNMMAQSSTQHTKDMVKTEQHHSILSDTIKLPEVTITSTFNHNTRYMEVGVISIDMPQIKQPETPNPINEKAADPPEAHQNKARDWFRHLFKKKQK